MEDDRGEYSVDGLNLSSSLGGSHNEVHHYSFMPSKQIVSNFCCCIFLYSSSFSCCLEFTSFLLIICIIERNHPPFFKNRIPSAFITITINHNMFLDGEIAST